MLDGCFGSQQLCLDLYWSRNLIVNVAINLLDETSLLDLGILCIGFRSRDFAAGGESVSLDGDVLCTQSLGQDSSWTSTSFGCCEPRLVGAREKRGGVGLFAHDGLELPDAAVVLAVVVAAFIVPTAVYLHSNLSALITGNKLL